MSAIKINWECEPNWIDNFSINYSFKTALHIAQNGKEQRAALQKRPLRKISFSIMEGSALATELVHDLMRSIGEAVAVPIFPQRFGLTDEGDIYNSYVIHGDGITNLFDVRRGEYVGYVLITGDVLPESTYTCDTKTVEGVSGNEITFESGPGAFGVRLNIIGTDAICYPAVVCYLESFEDITNTDNLSTIQFTFSEKNLTEGVIQTQ